MSVPGVASALDGVRDELTALETAGLLRTVRTVTPLPGGDPTRALVDGRPALVLCSNDYLGLAGDARLATAAARAAHEEGAGSGAARLISGTRAAHVELETAVRDLTGAPAALTFASGYSANVSVLGALLGPDDFVVSDRLNHASIIDGLRLSRARRVVAPHCDVAAVRSALASAPPRRRTAIVTEGLFSMDGDVAPLADLAAVAAEFDALLIVDDAHGTGVLGTTGGGAAEAAGITDYPGLVRVGTFGKSFGAAGAFVAGPAPVVELVLQRGRAFVFTTSPPPPVAAAALEGLRVATAEPALRARCLTVAGLIGERLRSHLGAARVPVVAGPIQPVLVGDPDRAVEASRTLLERHGVFVAAIRPPTVPEGGARLRVTSSAAVSEADATAAADAIAEVLA